MSHPALPHVVHVVATDAFAGVERYLTYIAPGLVQRGWAVTAVGGEPAAMQAAFHHTGVQHVPYPGLRRLQRWLRGAAATADIVHCHMTAAEFSAVRAVPADGPRLVTTRHFAAARGSSWLARAATRHVAGRMALQIAISQFVADAVGEHTVVIHNGVPAQALGTHHQQVVLLAQRLEPEKHTEVAVEAWARSGLAARGWQLHIAGDGSRRAALQQRAGELRVERSVHFLGHIDDVHRAMADCGVFVATAPAEPFGLSVVEAMASGALVLAAHGGAHRELITADTGCTFAPDDADELAALLTWAVDSPSERQQRGVRALQRQQAEFSVATHVERLDTAYRSLL